VQYLIKAAFPEAACQGHRGDDPAGIYIDSNTTAENGLDMRGYNGDRLVDRCNEAGLDIYVVPGTTKAKIFQHHSPDTEPLV
jgi:hypothetical protein